MQTRHTPEEKSKDLYFRRLAELAQEMVSAHGREFSMGALVLAARWIAEHRIGAEGGPQVDRQGASKLS